MPWLDLDALSIPREVHALPRHPEKVLPNFHPKKKELVEDHINKFVLAIRILNSEHGDVVCKLFPFTFKGKAFTWFFSLTIESIHSWNDFQTYFLAKLGEDKTPAKLFMKLSIIKWTLKKRFNILINVSSLSEIKFLQLPGQTMM